jgi:hypothetical protein
MKVKTVMFFALLLLNSVLIGQAIVEKNPKPKRVYNGPSGHAIGAVLSSSNGKGLAYRYWPENVGFHVSFFPAAKGDAKYYNGGVTGYLALREYEVGTLFLHVGAEYEYRSRNSSYSLSYPSFGTVSYLEKMKGLNLGFGPGLHVFQKYVSMDIFLGYGAYFRNYLGNDNYTPKDEVITTLTGGISFFLEL